MEYKTGSDSVDTEVLVSTTTLTPHYMFSDYLYIRACGIGILSSIGLVLNALTLWILIKHGHPKTNAQSRLVMNLCVTNLVLCAVLCPLNMYDQSRPGWDPGWWCRLIPCFQHIVQLNCFNTYLFITLHRYLLIVHPHSKKLSFGGPRKTILIIVVSLGLGGLTQVPPLFRLWGYFGFDPMRGLCVILQDGEVGGVSFMSYNAWGFMSALLVPLVPMAISYTVILYTLKKQDMRIKCSTTLANRTDFTKCAESAKAQARWRRRLRLTLVCLAMILTFMASLLPSILSNILPVLQKNRIYDAFKDVLLYLHAATDPLIYMCGDVTLLQHLHHMCCQKNQKNNQ